VCIYTITIILFNLGCSGKIFTSISKNNCFKLDQFRSTCNIILKFTKLYEQFCIQWIKAPSRKYVCGSIILLSLQIPICCLFCQTAASVKYKKIWMESCGYIYTIRLQYFRPSPRLTLPCWNMPEHVFSQYRVIYLRKRLRRNVLATRKRFPFKSYSLILMMMKVSSTFYSLCA